MTTTTTTNLRVPLRQLLKRLERGGEKDCGKLDHAANEVVAAPSGGGEAAGPSNDAAPARVPTASVYGPSGMGAPNPIDPEVNREYCFASFASVVRRFLTEVGLCPDEVAGATYGE